MAKKTYVTPDAGATWVQVASETTDLSPYAPKIDPTFTGTVTAPSIALTDTTDVSLSSTGNAIQIGATNDLNLVIDNNEIGVRNNGVATTMYLNADGGNVGINTTTGASGTTTIGNSTGSNSLVVNGSVTSTGTISGGNVWSDGGLGSGTKRSSSIADQTPGLGSTASNTITCSTNNASLYAQRLTDGSVIAIVGGTTTEGNISVSGTTVSYGSFCGAHWSQFKGITRPNILPGTVVETIDEMCEWWDEEGNLQPNDQLAKVKVSDTPESKAVYGVFQRYDDEEGGVNDIMVASIGAWLCRIQAGETLEVGDLLDSAGNGCAKVQSDDIMRSRTIAKVTSTVPYETYEDGSFVVPVTLHCG